MQKHHPFFLKNTFHPTTSQDRKNLIEGIIFVMKLKKSIKKNHYCRTAMSHEKSGPTCRATL